MKNTNTEPSSPPATAAPRCPKCKSAQKLPTFTCFNDWHYSSEPLSAIAGTARELDEYERTMFAQFDATAHAIEGGDFLGGEDTRAVVWGFRRLDQFYREVAQLRQERDALKHQLDVACEAVKAGIKESAQLRERVANLEQPLPFDTLPEDQRDHVEHWLTANDLKRSGVLWSLYPIGMVGRWIERAEKSEQDHKSEREARERAEGALREIQEKVAKIQKWGHGSYGCHIAPDRNDIEANKRKEAEGERIRAELEDFLTRNDIVGIMLDTEKHVVRVDINKLPPHIKPVLTLWGSIFVVDESGLAALKSSQESKDSGTA